MFFHSFRYAILELVREKEQTFWCILFPLILGTMFYLAFGNLDSSEAFSVIPVAAVLDDSDKAEDFRSVLDTLSEPGEDQFLEVTYTDEEEALSLLEKKEITGILYGGETLSLTISSDMSSSALSQSILTSFVQTFQLNYDTLMNIASSHPEKLEDAHNILTKDIAYNKETRYSDGTMDSSVQYFFNLIAMNCLMAAMGGCYFATQNQANLSSLGARKNISPVNKLVSIAGGLLANTIYQFFCVGLTLFYLSFVLKIDFGNQFGYSLLSIFVGCLTGISFGFLMGCIGHLSKMAKEAILMGGMMACCFFSGLMFGSMRNVVEHVFPLFNRINPAALISDCFYSLTVYSSYERFWQNILSLLVMSVLLSLGGFFIVRRDRYASL